MSEHGRARIKFVCPECSVVKPDRHAYFDHMLNVHQMTSRDVLITEAIRDLQSPTKPLHATTADTQPNQFAPGGVWMVGCETCGWTAVGKYGGVILTEETALATAHARGTHHEDRMNGKRAGT